MSLIIAGERSGVGKTTVTLSILAFLSQQKNKIVQGFKVGPDYIDPMFHTAITGCYCRNLDPVLTSPDYVCSCFALHSGSADYVVVEGVMGLFDGVKLYSETDYASTAHVARLLAIPVLLVLDCSRLSGSIAAIAHGFKTLDPRINIAGVVLNRIASDRHLELLEDALNNIKMPILGVIRRHSEITIPDRHLGLIPTAELSEITQVFNKLAHIAKTAFNWDKLLPLLRATTHNQPPYRHDGAYKLLRSPQKTRDCHLNLVQVLESLVAPHISRLYPLTTNNQSLKIAIARDRAFNFYYQDNLDILRQLGAELVFWSPLTAKSLPPNVAGFYFGGGFPEMFAEELAANKPVREQLKHSIAQNIPVYAECGGLMYLCDRLIDLESKIWDMVGFIPTTATMTSRLTLGYRQAFPLNSSSLIPTSSNSPTSIWGHEFHRSELTTISSQPLWQIKGCNLQSKMVTEGWQIKNVHASYVHLHFGKTKFLLKRWLDGCLDYKNQLA